MKQKKLLIAILVCLQMSVFSQLGINTTSPHSSSVLDITSTNKGVLLPRLDSNSINNLAKPIPEGLIVYNTTLHCLQYYNGNNWVGSNCSSTRTMVLNPNQKSVK